LQEEVENVEIDPSFKHKLNITLNNLNDSSIQDTSNKVCILLTGDGIKEVKDNKHQQEQLLT
jgi:intracellular sulfur oxidation DsrE/DsrF family protein